MSINVIYQNVIDGQAPAVEAGVNAALAQGMPASDILNQGLIRAMDEVGKRFEEGEFYVPEMLIVNTLLRSGEFDAWLAGLKEAVGRARILARLRAAEAGNFGDCQPVGEAVSEMRIHTGRCYRLYYMQYRSVIYLLLSGGDKSTQKRDIKRAIRMARTVREEGLS